MAMGVVYWLAGWTREQAEIGGLALSTTSLAVVYAVLLETGGSGSRSGRYGDRVIEPEIKLVFAALFVLYLGGRANSQAVLPAFVLGLAMSSHYDEHRTEQKRLRVVAFAFLTPFFFLKASVNVSLSAVWANLGTLALLAAAKMMPKFVPGTPPS